MLGIGRIIGDTAIIVILLGATLKNEPAGGVPLLGTLRGTGSTLTSYIYNNSPAGEGNAPQKAYAAAFVLLMIVLVLNALVTRLSGSGARAVGVDGGPLDAGRRRGPADAARSRPHRRSTRAAVAAPRARGQRRGAAAAALARAPGRPAVADRAASACASNRCGSPTARTGWCATSACRCARARCSR